MTQRLTHQPSECICCIVSSVLGRDRAEMDRGAEGNHLGSLSMRRGSSENNLDLDLDGSGSSLGFEVQRSRCLDNLQQKMLKITEQLKIEQTARDDNLAEYLKLVNNADKQQMGRIKQVFEKKNQKSSQSIAQMHKKLDQYHKKMKDIEIQQTTPPHPSRFKHSTIPRVSSRELLKDITGSGRHPTMDKIKTIGPGVSLFPPFFFSKPREFANLIRNKFGSADNIDHLKSPADATSPLPTDITLKSLSNSTSMVGKPKYPSDDECSSGSASVSDSNGITPEGGGGASEGHVHSQGPGQERQEQQSGAECNDRLALYLEEARELKVGQNQLEENLDELKMQFEREYEVLNDLRLEEKYRYEQLEDQLNDLTELHQNEMTNLKEELTRVEERGAYQAQERARDLQEMLESFENRVSKLELQQHQQQQTIALETHNARAVLGKTINVMIFIVTVLLVCVSTAARFAAPLMKSRLHVIATILGVGFLTFFWKNWDSLQHVIDRMLLPA
ncbi:transmembrane and coiled-coil domain protein 3-like isoform X2 [Eucyclogobius newberryi]|uniref:transmembrane and coiled-coil domain protein 3-like isoform X2 n=1 Tax=Eucyclogobius newberryi TaxID=166745 RepID=UPI003B5A1209